MVSLVLLSAPTGAMAAPNSCVAGKINCVAKQANAFIKCYAKAQKGGTAVSEECIAKASEKLLGTPTKPGCFDKLEDKMDAAKAATLCRTEDDDALIDALTGALTEATAYGRDPLSAGSCTHSPCSTGEALDGCSPCVEQVCSQPFLAHCCSTTWDVSCTAAAEYLCGASCGELSSTTGANTCAAGKSLCVAKKIKGLLECYKAAEKKGVAVDPACLQKVQDKFDGGDDPSRGCFAKLEAKQNVDKPASICRDDALDADAFAEYAAETITCNLDSQSCPCADGRCVNTVDDVPDAIVDRPLDMVCSQTCKAKTHFSAESGTCSTCAFGEICVEGECQCEVGEPRCQEIAPIPLCVNVSAASGMPSCGFLKNPNTVDGVLPPIGAGSHGTAWIDHFFEVEAYENEPVLIYINAKQLEPLIGNDFTPMVFSCDSGNGTFRAQDDELQRNYIDADGNILDLANFLAETNVNLSCKSFVDGPVYRGLPPIDPFSNPELKGYYLMFTPDAGESGRNYNQISILLDDSSSRVPAERYNPFHVLWFTIHVNPGPPPVPGPL
jgi:hypothetical protein